MILSESSEKLINVSGLQFRITMMIYLDSQCRSGLSYDNSRASPQFSYSHYRYDNEHVSKNSCYYNKYHYESRKNCHQNFDPFLIRYHVSTGCVVNFCEYCGVIPIENGHGDRPRRCWCDVFWWWGRHWYQGRHSSFKFLVNLVFPLSHNEKLHNVWHGVEMS